MKQTVWHYHHSRFLVEAPDETIESRCAFIDREKLPKEKALRKRLLQPVVGQLPSGLWEAWEAWDKAREARDKAREAWKVWEHAYRDNLPAINALHETECPDCPWDGTTIFTRENQNGEWY